MKHTYKLVSAAAESLSNQIIGIDRIISITLKESNKAIHLPMLLARSIDCRKYSQNFVSLFSKLVSLDENFFDPLNKQLDLLKRKINCEAEQKDTIDEKKVSFAEEQLARALVEEEKLRLDIAQKEKLLAKLKRKKKKKQSSEQAVYSPDEYAAALQSAVANEKLLLAEEEAKAKAEAKANKKKKKKNINTEESAADCIPASPVPVPAPPPEPIKPKAKKTKPVDNTNIAAEEADNWQIATNKKTTSPPRSREEEREHEKSQTLTSKPAKPQITPIKSKEAAAPAAPEPSVNKASVKSAPKNGVSAKWASRNPKLTVVEEETPAAPAPIIHAPTAIRPQIPSILNEDYIESKQVAPKPIEESHSANAAPMASATPAVASKKTLNPSAQEFIPQKNHFAEPQILGGMPLGIPYHPMPYPSNEPLGFDPFFIPYSYGRIPAPPIFPFEAIPVDASHHLTSAPAVLLHYDLDYYSQLVANAIHNNANKELHEIMKPLPDEIRLILLQRNEALLSEVMDHKHSDVLLAVLSCFDNKKLKYEFYICQGVDFAGDNFITAVKKLNGIDKESIRKSLSAFPF